MTELNDIKACKQKSGALDAKLLPEGQDCAKAMVEARDAEKASAGL